LILRRAAAVILKAEAEWQYVRAKSNSNGRKQNRDLKRTGRLKLPDDFLGTVTAFLNTKPPKRKRAGKKKIQSKADKK
jgi:hypothetical protein